MQFIVILDGHVVGQIFYDGKTEPAVPDGAVLLTVGQAVDLGLSVVQKIDTWQSGEQ